MDKKYVIRELSLVEVNTILSALSELPYKYVAELIAKIKSQGDLQYERNNP